MRSDDTTPAANRRAYQAAYYKANRDRLRAANDAWKAAHPDELREWYREHQKERYGAFQQYLRELMSERTCADCGGVPYHWHHVDPEQKYMDISHMHGCASETVEAELAKCVPLCRSCHQKRHALMREVDRRQTP